MRLFALRLLAVGVLVFLYQLHPAVGVAALATGFGYVVAQRTRTRGREQL